MVHPLASSQFLNISALSVYWHLKYSNFVLYNILVTVSFAFIPLFHSLVNYLGNYYIPFWDKTSILFEFVLQFISLILPFFMYWKNFELTRFHPIKYKNFIVNTGVTYRLNPFSCTSSIEKQSQFSGV
jgi:hypothetical protein